MSTIRCHAKNPANCTSPRCPNKTGRATNKFDRLSPSEQASFKRDMAAQAEARRVDAKLARLHRLPAR